MTNAPLNAASLRGAVDLSSLVRQHNTPAPAAGAPTGDVPANAAAESRAPNGYATSANDASFAQVLELSNTVPVIVEFFGQGIEASLEPTIAQYKGRFALVTVDATANPQLVQAFQVQEVPTVAAVIGGRPVQLFSGIMPESDLKEVFEQVLQLAAENKVTGTLPAADETAEGEAVEPVEEPLPPLHQEAFDAISAGDFATAIEAYTTAITQNPRDQQAIAGLAQVSLLARLEGHTADSVRSAAAQAPADVEAQLAVADLDVSGGHLGDAFDRLLELFPSADADGKGAIRTRLLDYFEIAGAEDPRVADARRRLTLLLY
ncbi:tetratricopeptide repeat protein [Salinibacterium sp. SWN1162]|uniref:tetratricopeptide repeat protein n=1 Tax=Salinibacterium sp. SWN1162 TaxID=2792053 RepID=UPI0018CD0FE0|nr:tetratricopeptide repeat protein [Salinibacterium sp. SWN1162]MBH0008960.1 tetratricopeptide repeat protein [Salinibacterium sp. SWN1162]